MSRVGDDLVEAFDEMAAWLKGEAQAETWEIPADEITAARIRAIRRSVSPSTKAFEAEFRIPRPHRRSLGAGAATARRRDGAAVAHLGKGAGGGAAGVAGRMTVAAGSVGFDRYDTAPVIAPRGLRPRPVVRLPPLESSLPFPDMTAIAVLHPSRARGFPTS